MNVRWIWLPVLLTATLAYGGDLDDKLAQAEKLCRAGLITSAQELLKEIPVADSLSPEALYGRGLIRQYQGCDWDGLIDYSLAAPKGDGFLPAIKAFTRLAIDLDYLPSARKMARIYAAKQPKDPAACLALAEIDLRERRFDSARVWVDKAATLTAPAATISTWQAAIDVYAGRIDTGLARLAGNKPTEPGQFRLRADLFRFLNMADSAIANLREATRLDPVDAGLKTTLGMWLVDYRRLRDAQEIADDLLKNTQRYGPAWILAASIKKAAYRPLEAETLFFKFLELADSPIVWEKHGDFLTDFGDLRTAVTEYQNGYILAVNRQYPDDYLRRLYRKTMNVLAENKDAVTMKEMVVNGADLAGVPDYDFYQAEAMRLFPDGIDSARVLVDNRLSKNTQDEVWLKLAGPYFLRGAEFEKAAECFERLLRFDYPEESSVVGLIRTFQAAQKPRRADSLAAGLPFRFQNSRRINEAFVALYRSVGENTQATVFAEKLRRMAPGYLPYDTILVSLYTAQGKTDAARTLLADYVQTYPDDPAGHYVLAEYDLTCGNLDAVEEHITQCLQLDSTFAMAYDLKGRWLRQRGQNDAALPWFRMAVDRNCQSPWSYYFVAEELFNRGDSLSRAANLGMTAVSLFTGERRGLELLGRIYLTQKNYRVAKSQFAQGLRQFPNDPVFQFYLGKTWLLLENPEEGKKLLEGALANGLAAPLQDEARQLLRGIKP